MGTHEQYPGWYARIEGPDGAGKTTQLELAKQYAEENNIKTLFIREPGTGEFGETIRDLLLHKSQFNFSPQTEYALFTANRTHLISDVILPAVQDGYTVISDRGIESSVAMQGGEAGAITAKAKGRDDSLTTEQIFEIGRLLLPKFYTEPNGLVLLSLSKEVRRSRMRAKAGSIGLDKIEQRTLAFSDATHDGYIALESLPYVTVINAEQSPEEMFKQARPVLFGPQHA